ncbi:hypothetical protein [Streptomyces sp. CB01881]|uniref:hypothetical protein n=1 Tax=Streptomyces sp. CB01881 TaxID=2078691 RepID=UPI000CDBFA75|nr:hypothetical protein [Streptomyces sp. CB01881]AUY52819.1 hypothetical protein C2142_32340 [Streptomyces sp. CB01881]TYC70538.1 hypothetical protein EH183_32405 [Streptomyces sp. CB01881]
MQPALRPVLTTAVTTALLGSAVPAGLTPAVAAVAVPAAAHRDANQGYSIPVGAVTDLGALPVLGGLGLDFARLLGQ